MQEQSLYTDLLLIITDQQHFQISFKSMRGVVKPEVSYVIHSNKLYLNWCTPF